MLVTKVLADGKNRRFVADGPAGRQREKLDRGFVPFLEKLRPEIDALREGIDGRERMHV